MISNVVKNAEAERDGSRWHVRHPSNDAILAYCETEREAHAVVLALDMLESTVNQLLTASHVLAERKDRPT